VFGINAMPNLVQIAEICLKQPILTVATSSLYGPNSASQQTGEYQEQIVKERGYQNIGYTRNRRRL